MLPQDEETAIPLPIAEVGKHLASGERGRFERSGAPKARAKWGAFFLAKKLRFYA